MPADTTTILVLGDIIGQPGMRAVVSSVKSLARKYRADVVIANGENANDGYGISADGMAQLKRAGVDIVTTGNHVWHDDHIADVLTREEYLLRPANYPGGVPGKGSVIFDRRSPAVAVINLQGRESMSAIDCPFRAARELVKRIRSTTPIIVVDFHAESTSEKEALGVYLDGDVSLVFGTHTHVQTADERILPKGTAYLTDVGACMPPHSVIGFTPSISMQRAVTLIPIKNEVASDAATIHGLVVVVNNADGKSRSIDRVQFKSLV